MEKRFKTKNWLQWMGVIGCLLFTSCKSSPESPMQAVTYETMKVATTDKALTTTYSATIRGRQDIDIYPQVADTIQELCDPRARRSARGKRSSSSTGCPTRRR